MVGPTDNGVLNFVLAGVGGQGTLLAADVISLVGMALGCDVKKSEVHGMAQRGGSVTSHVRWGRRVHSPLVATGEADYVVAFERLEALRYAGLLRPDGRLLINDHRIVPITVTSGSQLYPTEEDEERAYVALGIEPRYVPAMHMAEALGQPRVNNVVLLGALSTMLEVPEEVWRDVIVKRVPERYAELNRRAFETGRSFMMSRE